MTTPFLRDPARPLSEIQSALDDLEAHLASSTNPAERVRTLSQIGTLYRTSTDPARAVPYFEQAVQLARQRNLRADEAVNTLRLAVAYQYAGDPDAALPAFKAALVLCTQRRTHLDFAYQHWGKFLVEQGEPSLAVPYFEQALAMRLTSSNQELIASSRAALAAASGGVKEVKEVKGSDA